LPAGVAQCIARRGNTSRETGRRLVTIVTTVRTPTVPCLLLSNRRSIKYASFVSVNYCIYPSRLSPPFSAPLLARRSSTTGRQRPISSSGYAAPPPFRRGSPGLRAASPKKKERERERERGAKGKWGKGRGTEEREKNLLHISFNFALGARRFGDGGGGLERK